MNAYAHQLLEQAHHAYALALDYQRRGYALEQQAHDELARAREEPQRRSHHELHQPSSSPRVAPDAPLPQMVSLLRAAVPAGPRDGASHDAGWRDRAQVLVAEGAADGAVEAVDGDGDYLVDKDSLDISLETLAELVHWDE